MLKPLDIYVLLALVALPRDESWTQARFAETLRLPAPSLTRSLKRLGDAGLWNKDARRVDAAGAEELIVHAVRYLVPGNLGAPGRGIATAHSAPPLDEKIASDTVYVWPQDRGKSTGLTLKPLHASAPKAALENPALYELLALVDALRVGRARERAIAVKELHARIAKTV
jgi:hypothetical protein